MKYSMFLWIYLGVLIPFFGLGCCEKEHDGTFYEEKRRSPYDLALVCLNARGPWQEKDWDKDAFMCRLPVGDEGSDYESSAFAEIPVRPGMTYCQVWVILRELCRPRIVKDDGNFYYAATPFRGSRFLRGSNSFPGDLFKSYFAFFHQVAFGCRVGEEREKTVEELKAEMLEMYAARKVQLSAMSESLPCKSVEELRRLEDASVLIQATRVGIEYRYEQLRARLSPAEMRKFVVSILCRGDFIPSRL